MLAESAGDLPKAKQLYEDALAIYRRLHVADDRFAATMYNYALLIDEPVRAQSTLEEAYSLARDEMLRREIRGRLRREEPAQASEKTADVSNDSSSFETRQLSDKELWETMAAGDDDDPSVIMAHRRLQGSAASDSWLTAFLSCDDLQPVQLEDDGEYHVLQGTSRAGTIRALVDKPGGRFILQPSVLI